MVGAHFFVFPFGGFDILYHIILYNTISHTGSTPVIYALRTSETVRTAMPLALM